MTVTLVTNTLVYIASMYRVSEWYLIAPTQSKPHPLRKPHPTTLTTLCIGMDGYIKRRNVNKCNNSAKIIFILSITIKFLV